MDELPGIGLPTGIVLTDQVGGIEGQYNAGGNIHDHSPYISLAERLKLVLAAGGGKDGLYR